MDGGQLGVERASYLKETDPEPEVTMVCERCALQLDKESTSSTVIVILKVPLISL